MSSLRQNNIDEHWVHVATTRADRPLSTRCPFCPGHEIDTELALLTVGDPWSVRVVPNKYPAVDRSDGSHDVIIESRRHVTEISDLTNDEIENFLNVWSRRLTQLRAEGRECAVLFKNQGADAGASQAHVHSQVIGLQRIPPRLAVKLSLSSSYFNEHQRTWFEVAIAEAAEQERLIFRNENIAVIAPHASRVPFELWLLPVRPQAWYEHADSRTIRSLAEALRVVCRKLNVALDYPSYNLLLHSAPFTDEEMPHFSWHLELIPALTKIAGFEWGTGCYINPTPPEEAARQLRDIEI